MQAAWNPITKDYNSAFIYLCHYKISLTFCLKSLSDSFITTSVGETVASNITYHSITSALRLCCVFFGKQLQRALERPELLVFYVKRDVMQ